MFSIVELSEDVTRFMRTANEKTRRNVKRHFQGIVDNPYLGKKHLDGKAYCKWQDAFGRFRIEYKVDGRNIDILVVEPKKDRFRRSRR